eukprot:217576_1
MAYTAISTEAYDEIDSAFNDTDRAYGSTVSITPMERFSSADVVLAAEELKFVSARPICQIEPKPLKNAYHTIAQTYYINELERVYETSFKNGLNYNQIQMKRDTFGWNITTPPNKTHFIIDCLTDYSLWCLIISLILCIVITVMIPNIYAIILTIITFIPICLLILLTWCNKRFLDQQQYDPYALDKQTAAVTRNPNKTRYTILIDGIIRKQHSNPPIAIRKVILDYCCYSDHIINAKELVVGDIVHLKTGDMITADLRIFECSEDCKVDNSCLTGESEPQKRISNPSHDIPAEAANLLFYGTFLVKGNAKCVCVAIGDETFMGKTAALCVVEEYIDPVDKTIRSCKRC